MITSIDESYDTDFYTGFSLNEREIIVEWRGHKVSDQPAGKVIVPILSTNEERGLRKLYKSTVSAGASVEKKPDGTTSIDAYLQMGKQSEDGKKVKVKVGGELYQDRKGDKGGRFGVELSIDHV